MGCFPCFVIAILSWGCWQGGPGYICFGCCSGGMPFGGAFWQVDIYMIIRSFAHLVTSGYAGWHRYLLISVSNSAS